MMLMANQNNELNLALSYKNYNNIEYFSRCLLLTYLSAVEGGFSVITCILSILLCKSGYKYIKNNKEYPIKCEFHTFLNQGLSNRINYLSLYGFEHYSSMCNKLLRNAIGHANFVIYSDGSVRCFDISKLPDNPQSDDCGGFLIERDELIKKTWRLIQANNNMIESINNYFHYRLKMYNKETHPELFKNE